MSNWSFSSYETSPTSERGQVSSSSYELVHLYGTISTSPPIFKLDNYFEQYHYMQDKGNTMFALSVVVVD